MAHHWGILPRIVTPTARTKEDSTDAIMVNVRGGVHVQGTPGDQGTTQQSITGSTWQQVLSLPGSSVLWGV